MHKSILTGTDQFKHPDQFDLKVHNTEIEIKSSIEKYNKNIDFLIKNRRIIDNKHTSHENHSNIIVQVFFVPKNLDIAKKFESEMSLLEWGNNSIKKNCKNFRVTI